MAVRGLCRSLARSGAVGKPPHYRTSLMSRPPPSSPRPASRGLPTLAPHRDSLQSF